MALNSFGDIFASNNIFPQQPHLSPTSTPATEEYPIEDVSPHEVYRDIIVEEKKITTTTIDPGTQTLIKNSIHDIRDRLDAIMRLLDTPTTMITSEKPNEITVESPTVGDSSGLPENKNLETGEHIIHGIFNGESMVASDGQTYTVPENYASKSRIVEGDRMKLTITTGGRYIYKQIGPVDRKRSVGTIITMSGEGNWGILSLGKTYRVLTASVTFYRGVPGDEVVFLLSHENSCSWGAIESIVKK